ncbi:MAG TPA: hypothetical protein VGF99_08540 [Myxococcota bacterium]
MISRFLFNFLLFAVLLGGLGAFTLVQSGDVDGEAIGRVVGVTVLGAAWAGAMIAMIETRIYELAGFKRIVLAALCGGLAYVGLVVGLATVTTMRFGVSTPLLAVGAFVIGAVSHAVRARLYGDQSEEE